MRVSLNWLQEFAPVTGSPAAIAEQLTDLGLEVDEIITVGGSLGGVIVARVLEVRPHPDADRVRLVDVDTGDGRALQIVCGATNMVAGDLVPLATVGTVMPGGMEIAARKMRGEMSNGMLCSAAELELGDDHSGILVLGGTAESQPAPGTPLAEALELRSDVVFDVDVNPNRPDALSVVGVARDLAARQGVPFHVPEPAPPTTGPDVAGTAAVVIEDPVLCGRFAVRALADVRIGPSPRWMAQRLLAAGMRPINSVVDASNYVMLELGQPSHAFDLATLADGGDGPTLRVRRARAGERLETLDGVVRDLDPADGVIADADDAVIGLAGVMGGASTEISEATTDVLVEAAWWDPQSIADTAARHSLHSEASARFKRGVDTAAADRAIARLAELLVGDGAATLRPGSVVAEGDLPERITVTVRPSKVNAVLGTRLDRGLMVDLIAPIGFTSTEQGDDLAVDIPSWRPDSSTEIDVVEEIGRMYGLSRIERTVPVSPHPGGLSGPQRTRRSVRRALAGFGVSEAMPMPFLAPGDLERCGLPATGLVLANPLAAEESVLRTSLRPGLLAAVAHNAKHRIDGVWLSEIGRVFELGDRGPIVDVEESSRLGRVLDGEREQLAVVLAGAEAPTAVELLDVVVAAMGIGPVVLRAEELPGLHPARSATVEIAGAHAGEVGEIDPEVLDRFGIEQRVAWLELELGALLDLPAPVHLARPVSRFPSADVDLAFVVEDRIPAAAVRATIRAAGAPLLRRLELFDVFRSDAFEGARSLAFRLRFQADDRTLTDAEVGVVRQAIIDEVVATHDATLRA
ncbi:phenylalanine--tRNA ligase subunit beta [Dermatobacter hominis]|uniref:phenylalanine--tRNA ligase subunit beta n=1 Tax=Dermatobacter hominis TaxID=2884263 RepID=UPI001D0F9FAE|nr:phenylalanine--tRNA ligase subunit beta [Dermatobacter hominis]UDY36223.1 phenylalanine--tRNA ligase subunit beta [Dermatobacter hominis]